MSLRHSKVCDLCGSEIDFDAPGRTLCARMLVSGGRTGYDVDVCQRCATRPISDLAQKVFDLVGSPERQYA